MFPVQLRMTNRRFQKLEDTSWSNSYVVIEKKESLSDKCSLDKLAEAPGSRQLDVGQTKNYHHSQEKEIEHCPLTNSKIKMDFCNILQSIAKCFIDNHNKKF